MAKKDSFFSRRAKEKLKDMVNDEADKQVQELVDTVDDLINAAVHEEVSAMIVTEVAVPEAPASVIKSAEPTKKHTAFNTYYDESIKKFVLVSIEYDPLNTKDCRVVSVVPFADDKSVATVKLNNLYALKIFRAEERLK